MPNPRAPSPPPQASDWTRESSEVATRSSADPKSDSSLAERRRGTAAPAKVVTSRRWSKNPYQEEEEDAVAQRSSLSSPISLQPPEDPSPSPNGLLLFRRRSSTNVAAQNDDTSSSLPLHPLDRSLSRRSSDGSSSALNPTLSGSASRRGSWSTAAGEENVNASRTTSHSYLPPPSSSSAHFLSTSRYNDRSALSPIEASPLIPSSIKSTPRTSPESSVELFSSPTFSSPSVSDRSPDVEPFLSPSDLTTRRPSYSVIELESRRLSSQSSAAGLLLPTPTPVSARSIRRQLRRILIASVSLFVLICFIRPSRLELVHSFVRNRSLPIVGHYDVGHFLTSKPNRADILPRNKTHSKKVWESNEEVLQDEQELNVVYPVREEVKRFREEQLWAPSDVKLKTRVVEPKGDHQATIIMIHGLSQTIEHNSWLHHELGAKLPSVRWVMPQAPKLPITWHKQELRPAWFDIKSFPWNGIEDSDEEHYFASTRALNGIIREERDRLIKSERQRQGVDISTPASKEEQEWASKRILIGGFSQGGVMSLLVGLTNEYQLGGIMVFSGMLPVRGLLPELARDLNHSDLPIWWGHGELDPYLLSKDAASSVEVLRDASPGLALSRVTFQTYPQLQHTWMRKEVDDLVSWMSHSLESPLRPVVQPSHRLSRSRRRK